MKKIMLYVLILATVLVVLSMNVSAQEDIDTDSLIGEYTDSMSALLDDDAIEILSSFGLDNVTADNIFNLSFTDVMRSLGDVFSISIKDTVSTFFKMLGMIIILITINSFKSEQYWYSKQISDIFSIICVILIASSLNDCINDLAVAFELTSKLMITYVPILTVLLSVSGNITSSVWYNSGVLALAQILSAISKELLIPLISMYFALLIAMSLNETLNAERITASINKTVTTSISTMTLIFTLIISAKNVLAKDIDGVLYKSGKYLVSNMIPIIGPSISSVLNSIVGSLSLVKNTVAIFAIICVITVNLPVLAGLSMNYFALHLISIIAESFGERQTAGIFRGFSNGVKILIVLVVFELVLVIISTGLILTIRGEI